MPRSRCGTEVIPRRASALRPFGIEGRFVKEALGSRLPVPVCIPSHLLFPTVFGLTGRQDQSPEHLTSICRNDPPPIKALPRPCLLGQVGHSEYQGPAGKSPSSGRRERRTSRLPAFRSSSPMEPSAAGSPGHASDRACPLRGLPLAAGPVCGRLWRSLDSSGLDRLATSDGTQCLDRVAWWPRPSGEDRRPPI
jgi:hypothetical protein